jgi:hypothetical protein
MLLLLPVAAWLYYGSRQPGVPEPLQWLLVLMCLAVLAAVAGALVSVDMSIDRAGRLSVDRWVFGFLPFGRRKFAPGEVLAIALDRRMSASVRRYGSSSPSTPRFRIDLQTPQGLFMAVSGTDGGAMSQEARTMARILGCPFEATGSQR